MKNSSAIKDSFSVVALGGLGEIGMNCLVIETEGRLLIIDCGVMFSPENLGIEMIHPGFEYLAERRDEIEALVLTHAHEDHIAAVPFVLRELDVPVYGPPYPLGLLSTRKDDFDGIKKLVARLLNPGDQLQLGPFAVTTFPMPHSVVDNTGLVVDMPHGRILHTGDFKLGLEGPNRGADVLERLSEFADGRVDLMLADSTGSEEEVVAGDESNVARTVQKLTREAKGRVFIAIFSSNVMRLRSLLQVAKSCDRRVTLCGRSVQTHVRVAVDTGHLQIPEGLMVSIDKAADLPGSSSLVIVSGTQGEERSALNRLASASHRNLRIEKDDLVILSSRFIPGNEVAIGNVIDKLQRIGARVMHRGVESGVHVSGHGSKQEIVKAIEAVKPSCFVPVHGTYRHLTAAATLAHNAGVKSVAIAGDGDLVCHQPDGLTIEKSAVATRRIFIDRGARLPESAIRDRRLLGLNGALFVSFATDGDGMVSGNVDVIARGVTYEEMLPWLRDNISSEIKRVMQKIDPSDRRDSDRLNALLRSALRRFLIKQISREPYVLISILPISE
jgi:ribonuclease J